jgi:hypothetical protein
MRAGTQVEDKDVWSFVCPLLFALLFLPLLRLLVVEKGAL